MSGSDSDAPAGLFEEPEGYFVEHQGKREVYKRTAPRAGQPTTLTLHLAPRHSLWGHELWNASRFLAEAIDSGELSVAGCATLELGAGAGLPSLSAALGGAHAVVCTDYGTEADDSLVAALRANAAALAAVRDAAAAAGGAAAWCDVQVAPHIWGTDCAPLLALLPPARQAAAAASDAAAPRRFDRIFLADLLFNRQSHRQLLATCAECLAPGGTVWVAYSHHDPGKAALDNAFFPLAQAAPYGFAVRKVREVRFERDLFVEGDGLDEARAVVYFYELTHGSGGESGVAIGEAAAAPAQP